MMKSKEVRAEMPESLFLYTRVCDNKKGEEII